jgi:hypothetical protein
MIKAHHGKVGTALLEECDALRAEVERLKQDREHWSEIAGEQGRRRIAADQEVTRLREALTALSFTRPDGSLCYDAGRCKNFIVSALDVGEYVPKAMHAEPCSKARAALATGATEEPST